VDQSADARKLIFDVGFHNGDDTAYYLSRGHRVVAIEANPVLAEEGRRKFHAEIESGSLTLVNCGVWHRGRTLLTFFVNETDSGWSSFVKDLGQRGGKYHEIQIECVTTAELFEKYGVPWYLKVDIEGSDKAVVSTLTGKNAPRYLSCELEHDSPALDLLSECGYTGFKLVNQVTFTQSLPIFDNQFPIRAVRKLSVQLPLFRKAIAGLPDALRSKYMLWDTFRDKYPYTFSRYSSGPFGEDTEGEWVSASAMRAKLSYLFHQFGRYGLEREFWFDLHARFGTKATAH